MKKKFCSFLLIVYLCCANNDTQVITVVCGAGGFIGHHLVKELKSQGCWVRGVDLKYPDFTKTVADEFILGDLRDSNVCENVLKSPFLGKKIDHVYQLAADVGGIGYIVSHDAQIMSNSIRINVNMLEACRMAKVKKIFFCCRDMFLDKGYLFLTASLFRYI